MTLIRYNSSGGQGVHIREVVTSCASYGVSARVLCGIERSIGFLQYVSSLDHSSPATGNTRADRCFDRLPVVLPDSLGNGRAASLSAYFGFLRGLAGEDDKKFLTTNSADGIRCPHAFTHRLGDTL